MTEDVIERKIMLNSESMAILNKVDEIHQNTAIHMGLKLLSSSNLYKNFLVRPDDRVLTDQNDSLVLEERIPIDSGSAISIELLDTSSTSEIESSDSLVNGSQVLVTETLPVKEDSNSPKPDWDKIKF